MPERGSHPWESPLLSPEASAHPTGMMVSTAAWYRMVGMYGYTQGGRVCTMVGSTPCTMVSSTPCTMVGSPCTTGPPCTTGLPAPLVHASLVHASLVHGSGGPWAQVVHGLRWSMWQNQ